MKKTVLFLTFLFFFVSQKGISQEIQWGKTFESPAKRSILEYAGSDGGIDYYCFDYYYLYGHFKNISFAAVKEGNIIKTSPKEDIKKGALEKFYIEGNEIKVIYSYYNENNETYEVICRSIDKTTLITKREKVILSYQSSKRNVNYIHIKQSPDKSKIMIGYMDVDKKTNRGFLDVTVFDSGFEKLWAKQYYSQVNGELFLRDFSLSDDGELAIVAVSQIIEHKKAVSRKIIVVKIGDDLFEESSFSYDNEIDFVSLKSLPLDDKRIAVAGIAEPESSLITYVLNLESQRKESQTKVQLEKKLRWIIGDVKKLANQNFVVACENAVVTKIISSGPDIYTFINNNLRIIGIDPEKKEPVYDQLIARGTISKSYIPHSHWKFEKPVYFVSGDKFYVLYNTSKKVDEFSERPLMASRTKFKKKNSDIETRMIAFDANGKTRRTTLFTEKETGGRLSSIVSYQKDETEAVIAKVAKETEVTTGILQLK